jgi:pimeloyl-ACP methyl ester carboxylesterase
MIVFIQLCSAVALFGFAGVSAHADDAKVCVAEASRPDKVDGIREHSIDTADGRVAYYRFGHGSPIVFITGYRATISEWNVSFLKALAEQHEIIIYDNRGAGRSVSGAESYDVKDMAEDAAHLISSLGLHDVTVVGWSMGGIVAQQLALDAPTRIRRLVLINTMAPGTAGQGPSPASIKTLGGEGPTHFSEVIYLLFPADAAPHAEKCFIQDMFSPAGYRPASVSASAARAQEAIMRDWAGNDAVYPELHNVKLPVLLLSGEDDAIVPPENSVALQRAFPKSTLFEYKHAGHAMMYQFPGQIAAKIAAFIRSDNQP